MTQMLLFFLGLRLLDILYVQEVLSLFHIVTYSESLYKLDKTSETFCRKLDNVGTNSNSLFNGII